MKDESFITVKMKKCRVESKKVKKEGIKPGQGNNIRWNSVCVWGGGGGPKRIEPPHDKTNKTACATSEDRSAWASA